ncbi:MAG: hypothetical protein ACO1SX_08995, partial [Actinomycetota bacterium]
MTISDPPSGDPFIPVGAWLHLQPGDGSSLVGFTFLDPHAGFSAQGPPLEGSTLDPSVHVIVRLSGPDVRWRPLTAEETKRFNLETPPSWVAEHYGPQPDPGTLWGAWRAHPKLRGRLHPDHPDDLQVIVHDGGPRISTHAPEAVWVSVTGA